MARRVTDKARLFGKILRSGPNDCWPWAGAVSRGGYGRTHIYIDGARFNRNAHQALWITLYGDTNGLYVLHRCDNRLCCNPAHLFLGTTQDNTADRHAKGRDASGARNTKTRLSAEDVARIHDLRAQGMSGPRIAALFGINNTSVYKVLRGKNHARTTAQLLASGGGK